MVFTKTGIPGLPGLNKTLSAEELSSHSSALSNLRLHEFFVASADFYIKASVTLDLQALRAYYASLRQIFEYLCAARNQDKNILNTMTTEFDNSWNNIVSLTIKFENQKTVNYTEYLQYLKNLQVLDAKMVLAWQIPLQYFFRTSQASTHSQDAEILEKTETETEKEINETSIKETETEVNQTEETP